MRSDTTIAGTLLYTGFAQIIHANPAWHGIFMPDKHKPVTLYSCLFFPCQPISEMHAMRLI